MCGNFLRDTDLARDNGFSRYRGFKDDMDTPTKRGGGGSRKLTERDPITMRYPWSVLYLMHYTINNLSTLTHRTCDTNA